MIIRNSSVPRFELSKGTHPRPLPGGEYRGDSPPGRGYGWANSYDNSNPSGPELIAREPEKQALKNSIAEKETVYDLSGNRE